MYCFLSYSRLAVLIKRNLADWSPIFLRRNKMKSRMSLSNWSLVTWMTLVTHYYGYFTANHWNQNPAIEMLGKCVLVCSMTTHPLPAQSIQNWGWQRFGTFYSPVVPWAYCTWKPCTWLQSSPVGVFRESSNEKNTGYIDVTPVLWVNVGALKWALQLLAYVRGIPTTDLFFCISPIKPVPLGCSSKPLWQSGIWNTVNSCCFYRDQTCVIISIHETVVV